jgi:hypothetical protein
VHLPPARYGAPVDPSRATIITIAQPEGAKEPLVYLADGAKGMPLPSNAEEAAKEIRAAVEASLLDSPPRQHVLIKAERGVKHREVARVAAAAGQFEGVTLNVAVLEIGAEE